LKTARLQLEKLLLARLDVHHHRPGGHLRLQIHPHVEHDNELLRERLLNAPLPDLDNDVDEPR